MIDDLILRVQYNGSTHDLPIDNEVPMRIDMSAVENGEIGTYFGIGSQTFSIPGTREVNRFFNHGYDISIDDIPGMYNSIPCAVIHNGETLIQGQLILEEIITREDGDVTYSVNVTDSTVQFKNNLEGKLLKDINLDAYNHELTAAFITGSWKNNNGGYFMDFPPLGGVVFYPMADYGTDEVIPFPTQPKIMGSDGSLLVTTGSITNPSTPMLLKQFQPAVRLPELLDAVFDQAGFSYVSSFIDTKADNMYVLPKANDSLGPVLSDLNDLDATNDGLQLIPAIPPGGVITGSIEYTIENKDKGNNYDTGSSVYTVPKNDTYKISFGAKFPSVGNESGVLIGYDVKLLLNGVEIWNAFQSEDISPFPIEVFGVFEDNFFAGNQLSLQYRITNFNGTVPTNARYMNTGGYFIVDSKIDYENAIINLADQFDPKSKSIDLITGLIEQFNLVVVPEPNKDRVLRVETFDDWIRRGERKDWTFRYDTAKKISINHTVDEQPKQLLFQNEKDSDRISKVYTESVPNYQYGTTRVIADSNIPQGEREVGSFFASLVTAPMISSSVFLDAESNPTTTYTNEFSNTPSVVPHLYKFENNQQTTYKFKPRLGYKVGGFGVYRNDTYGGFWIQSGSNGGAEPVNDLYSTLNSMNYPGGRFPTSINFDSSDTTYMPPSFYQASSGSNAYVDYWQTYIESLYWEGSKKLTLDLYFEPFEYKGIQLNDRIVIKNQVYRINKISGFNISYPDVVTVELIKLYPEYITPGNEIEPWPEPAPPVELYYELRRCSDSATGFISDQLITELFIPLNGRVTDTSLEEYVVIGNAASGTSVGIITNTGQTGCSSGPGPGAGRQMFFIYPSNAVAPYGTFSWTCQDGSSGSVTLGWDQDYYACIQDGTSVSAPPGGIVQDYGLGCVGCQW